MKIIIFVLTILLGAFLFVYGGYDDSPGAQLLGLVIAIFGLVGIVIRIRKSRKNTKNAA